MMIVNTCVDVLDDIANFVTSFNTTTISEVSPAEIIALTLDSTITFQIAEP